MKKLLITLLLVSPFSFADWGDVYYCQMTVHSSIASSGQQYQLTLEKFTFKLDKTKRAMVFGKGNAFSQKTYGLESAGQFPSQERWYAQLEKDNSTETVELYGLEVFSFFKGHLVSSFVSQDGIQSMSATCDKF